MKGKVIVPNDSIAAHEQAAAEVAELRRKGIHCHIEEPAGHDGAPEVVRDEGRQKPERGEK